MDQKTFKTELSWEEVENRVPEGVPEMKLEEDDGIDFIDISSDEDSQDEVKKEIKVEEFDTCSASFVAEEDGMLKHHPQNSNLMDGSGSPKVAGTDETLEEGETADSEGIEDNMYDILEMVLKGYCETFMKSQNMLFAVAYSFPKQDITVVRDIVISGRELATSIRLMADTVNKLAVAERMKSKAAIIKTRIELAKAKRAGIHIQL